MTFRRGLWVVTGLAAAGVVWAAVLIVGLLAGVRLVPLPVAAAVAALPVIPGFVAAVFSNVFESGWRRRREVNLRRALAGLPVSARAAVGVAFVGFWLAGVTALIGTAGSAEIRNGRYVLNNHGTVTAVDKATYDRQVSHEERLALGTLGGLGVAGVTLAAAAAIRTGPTR